MSYLSVAEMVSPCAQCEIHLSGADKTCNPDCRDCDERSDYVKDVDPENLSRPFSRHSLYNVHPGRIMTMENIEREDALLDEIRDFAIEYCRDHHIDFESVVAGSRHRIHVDGRRKLVHSIARNFDVSMRVMGKSIGVALSTFQQILMGRRGN